MSVQSTLVRIEPQRGDAVTLAAGDTLRIVALEDEQVADLAIFARYDLADSFSPGRTIDYNQRLVPRAGDALFSHRSTRLAMIAFDSVGVHDLLLTPCSRAMFERRGEHDHPSCHENLARALARYGLGEDDIRATLNVFMDVRVNGNAVSIQPPPSRRGDAFEIKAETDLVVAIAACASELTNNGRCKPVAYQHLKQDGLKFSGRGESHALVQGDGGLIEIVDVER
jgi:uncharacterized protein YcgI (DUF1989 family)